LQREAAHCRACDLWRHATQTVTGEGPASASLMLVGEQPGDKEDLAGKPFVGPAGGLLDRALGEAGIGRDAVYITNAVKHFKFEERGKRRLHKRPNTTEIEACKWWLEQELTLLRPHGIVALGATAARSLLGHTVTIGNVRGKPMAYEALSYPALILVTVHPSSLLRQPDETRRHADFARFVGDLAVLWKKLGEEGLI
jgi:DNA polymerase